MLLSRLTSRLPRLQQLTQHLQFSRPNPLPAILHTAQSATYATMCDQSKWKFNHTMLRVKDPKKSLDYYKLLGLSQVNKLEFPEAKFDLYFLGTP